MKNLKTYGFYSILFSLLSVGCTRATTFSQTPTNSQLSGNSSLSSSSSNNTISSTPAAQAQNTPNIPSMPSVPSSPVAPVAPIATTTPPAPSTRAPSTGTPSIASMGTVPVLGNLILPYGQLSNGVASDVVAFVENSGMTGGGRIHVTNLATSTDEIVSFSCFGWSTCISGQYPAYVNLSADSRYLYIQDYAAGASLPFQIKQINVASGSSRVLVSTSAQTGFNLFMDGTIIIPPDNGSSTVTILSGLASDGAPQSLSFAGVNGPYIAKLFSYSPDLHILLYANQANSGSATIQSLNLGNGISAVVTSVPNGKSVRFLSNLFTNVTAIALGDGSTANNAYYTLSTSTNQIQQLPSLNGTVFNSTDTKLVGAGFWGFTVNPDGSTTNYRVVFSSNAVIQTVDVPVMSNIQDYSFGSNWAYNPNTGNYEALNLSTLAVLSSFSLGSQESSLIPLANQDILQIVYQSNLIQAFSHHADGTSTVLTQLSLTNAINWGGGLPAVVMSPDQTQILLEFHSPGLSASPSRYMHLSLSNGSASAEVADEGDVPMYNLTGVEENILFSSDLTKMIYLGDQSAGASGNNPALVIKAISL